MPIAEVQLPDGRVAELEVPQGATEQQITEFAQSQFPGGGPDQQTPASARQSLLQKIDESIPDLVAEAASAINRGAVNTADFLGSPVSYAAGAIREGTLNPQNAPTIRGALRDTPFSVEGGFMEDGLPRDIVRTGGELVGPGAAAGSALRAGARALPAAVPGESVATGALRQAGASTPRQEAVYSGVSGAGSEVGGEVGESIGGETGRQVGEMAGALGAPVAASAATPGAVRGMFRGGERGRQTLEDAVADFAEINTAPSVGQGTEDGFRRGVETLSSKILGGGPIRRSIENTSKRMQQRVQEISDDISPVRGQVEAGRVVQRGITGDDGFIQRFNKKGGELWTRVDKKIGEGESEIKNTRDVLGTLVRDDQFAKMLNNPVLSGLRKSVESTLGKTRINNATQTRETVSSIPYRDLKALRTSVGEMLSSRDLISDVPRSQLKRLYGALSEDTREAAKRAGALQDFSRANSFTRAGHNRVDDFVDRVASKVDLDKVYQALARGGEGIQSLNAVKRSLKSDEWEAVASNVIRNLGKATPGQQDATGEAFSVNKFLTDWNRLGEGKRVLFSGSDKLNSYRENLNRIARSAERFKESAQEMANPSGTGQFVANVGILTSSGAALGTGNFPTLGLILSGVAANNGAARLMTNPRFVKWLAKGTRTDDWPSHIAALNGIAKSEGLEQDVSDLLETIKVQPETKASQIQAPGAL